MRGLPWALALLMVGVSLAGCLGGADVTPAASADPDPAGPDGRNRTCTGCVGPTGVVAGNVTLDPVNATVPVNLTFGFGAPAPTVLTLQGGGPFSIELVAQSYLVRVEAAGYVAATREIAVAENDTTFLVVSLVTGRPPSHLHEYANGTMTGIGMPFNDSRLLGTGPNIGWDAPLTPRHLFVHAEWEGTASGLILEVRGGCEGNGGCDPLYRLIAKADVSPLKVHLDADRWAWVPASNETDATVAIDITTRMTGDAGDVAFRAPVRIQAVLYVNSDPADPDDPFAVPLTDD